MYILDEEKIIKNGVYEGYLDNDKVNQLSILIYTDKRLSGQKLSNYSVSKVLDKTKIRISDVNGKIYISYECEGIEVKSPVKIEIKKEVDQTLDMKYIEAELFKKADKINTFTKNQVLDKIKDIDIDVIDGGSFV